MAIEAAADVISIAKARLNDTGRPLASFLFLGATGVGKTEAAKQIAAYLYGAEEKLLRFDMNEFVSPFDVARLVGDVRSAGRTFNERDSPTAFFRRAFGRNRKGGRGRFLICCCRFSAKVA